MVIIISFVVAVVVLALIIGCQLALDPEHRRRG